MVSGGGGKGLYPVGRSKWTVFSKSAHHAVLVRIDGRRLSLEAIEPNGTVLDRMDLTAGCGDIDPRPSCM